MRKYFIISLILILGIGQLCADSVFGAEYGVTVGRASTGFGGFTTEPASKNVSSYGQDVDYLVMEVRLWVVGLFYVEGGTTVQATLQREAFAENRYTKLIPNYNPSFINYNFGFGMDLGLIRIFYSHDCTHPQFVYNYSYRVTSLWGEGSVDRIGVAVEGSIGTVGK